MKEVPKEGGKPVNVEKHISIKVDPVTGKL